MACNCNNINLNDGVNSTDAIFALADQCHKHNGCRKYGCGCGCDSEPQEQSSGCEGTDIRCICSDDSQSRRICCDSDGCCGKYPCRCRDSFWPEFAHPRWLSCECLYSCDCDNDCGCND